MSDGPYGRASFEFDAIDADITDAVGPKIRELFRDGETKPFALLRIVTTTARFFEFGGAIPTPGDWFILEIEPRGHRPGLMTWHAQLGPSGYTSHSRGLTVKARRLPSEDDEPRHPRSLGAAVAPRATLPQYIDQISRLPSRSAGSAAVRAALLGITPPAAVVVRDVGQASFSSLVDIQGKSLIHFDVGFPISFNRHTSPKNFAFDPAEKPLIILSHWDWDHLHAAFALSHLRECKWIAPRQRIGPGAARLALILAAKGNLMIWQTGSNVAFPGGSLMDCAGPGGGQNDTGLALHTRLAGGNTVLLTGDADYQCLPPGCAALGPVTHLIATHHGARFKSLAPQIPLPTTTRCTMVVSYGTRNVYRHPHVEALRVHASAGWSHWISTAGRRGFGARGDRWLR